MEDSRSPSKRQASILLDEDDYVELERIARAKRSNVSQVIREFVAAGISRDRMPQAAERVA